VLLGHGLSKAFLVPDLCRIDHVDGKKNHISFLLHIGLTIWKVQTPMTSNENKEIYEITGGKGKLQLHPPSKYNC
jgi:hypothetical protein